MSALDTPAKNAFTTRKEDVLRAAGPARASGRRWRWALLGLASCALLAGGALAYQKASTPKPTSFVTAQVSQGDLVEVVTAVGTLAPVDAVELGAEVTGRLTRVLVDVNDPVEAGQILAEIDPEQLQARVRESRAQLSSATANQVSAQASLTEAEQKAERMAALHKEGIATGDENEAASASLERARASIGVAAAQITVARASLASAETLLERAVIRAPIAGIVLSRTIEPGQTVTAGFQTPVLFTLARDLAQLELEVEVDEADIGKVREGQAASFEVDAYPGRTFRSKLLKLHNLPKAGAAIVTYSAVLSVDNQDRSLRPGMTATASIVTDQLTNVLLVDNAALRFEPPRAASSRARGFLPIPGFGGPPTAQRGGAAGRSGAAPSGDRVFVKAAQGEPRRVPVEVLATDGEKSAISPRKPRASAALDADSPSPAAEAARSPAPTLSPGTEVIIDVASGDDS